LQRLYPRRYVGHERDGRLRTRLQNAFAVGAVMRSVVGRDSPKASEWSRRCNSWGYVVPPIALPELPVLLAPDFGWPDIELPMHGSARLW
jgi:hypothetical protein